MVGEEEVSGIFEIGYHDRTSFSNDFAQDATAVCISPYKTDIHEHVYAIGTENGRVHVMKTSGPSHNILERNAEMESVISLVVHRNFHSSVRSLAFANEVGWDFVSTCSIHKAYSVWNHGLLCVNNHALQSGMLH